MRPAARRISVGVPLLGVLLAVLPAATEGGTGAAAAAAPAKIVFVNVGQGDAVAIRIGATIVLADAGEFEVDEVDAALRDLGAKEIDVAILSHPHDDHVENFRALVERFGWRIELAVLSRSEAWDGTATNRRLMAALRERSVPVRFVTAGDRFRWGGGSWTILNPPAGRFTGRHDAANASIAFRLRLRAVDALFTGDVGPATAAQIAARWLERGFDRAEIFLATHHGSKHGSTAELLDAVRPAWAVLSAGKNGFGHPDPEAIERLQSVGATIWCTAVNGSVTARISPTGRLTWRASLQRAPWWSGRDRRRNGTCVGR